MNIIWGWLLVSLIILCVATSLGEITSVYPTAGGVYYQTFMLSSPRYRRIFAWICGWSYVVGNVMITLAVNFGSAQFIISCVQVFEKSPGVPIWQETTYQTFLIFLAITILCNAVSALGNKWLPWLDVSLHWTTRYNLSKLTASQTFAIYWTIIGTIAIVICILVIAKNGRHTGAYVFGDFSPQSGWPAGWSFCVGLLQAAYTTSSTGMVISYANPLSQYHRAKLTESQHVRRSQRALASSPKSNHRNRHLQHHCRPDLPDPHSLCIARSCHTRRPCVWSARSDYH